MKSIVSKVRMGVSLAALSLMTVGALAQDFKLSSQWLENTVVSQTNRWWAEELDKRSPRPSDVPGAPGSTPPGALPATSGTPNPGRRSGGGMFE